MLTRVYIDNFRCFVNFEYRPGRKQLLLGANGSGKSSLLEAIRHLKWFGKGDPRAFTQSTRTRWQDRPVQVIEVEADLGGERYDYRVEIRFGVESRELLVGLERLRVSGAVVFEVADKEIKFVSNTGEPHALPLQIATSALHLLQLSNAKVQRFVKWLETVHCFRIDEYPDAMEEHADKESSEPDDELQNLAGWYRYLVQAFPEENVRFLTSLREVLQGFQTLRFSSDEVGMRRLRADFTAPRKGKVTYAISELSEGQRCLLALYMILHFLIARGDTVFIDEPDNFIALREIQPWLLSAEQAVEDGYGQLILISHHPEVLNQWALAYGLRFFREENGQVRTEIFRPDPNGDLQPAELIARGWEGE